MTTKFDRDTAVSDGRAHVSEDWFVIRGPNGGYLAAILVRALEQHVDPGRRLRSLTIHYTAPPVSGPVDVRVTVERAGRSMTFLSARMEQNAGGGDGAGSAPRLVALALAALSGPREGIEFHEETMPDVPAPADCPPLFERPKLPRFAANWEFRPVFEQTPFAGGERSEVGGWIRLREGRTLDYPLAASLTDAWFPAVFRRLPVPEPVPTVDLTVHFRAELPLPAAGPDDSVLALFRSRHAGGGYVEEDGTIWAADGTLLVQSRQLALLHGDARALQAPAQT